MSRIKLQFKNQFLKRPRGSFNYIHYYSAVRSNLLSQPHVTYSNILLSGGHGSINRHNLESFRRLIRRKLGRKVKARLLVRPNHPWTSKKTGARMGKGKGSVDRITRKVAAFSPLFKSRTYLNMYSGLFLSHFLIGKKRLPFFLIVRRKLSANLKISSSSTTFKV